MTQVAAGWYPDPGAPGQVQLRYWDGQRWTEHVHDTANVLPSQPQATTPDGVPLAGWWVRVLALFLDYLVIGVVSTVITLPLQIQLQRDLQVLMERFEAQTRASGAVPSPGQFLRDYLDVLLPMVTWSAVIGFVLWALYNAVFLRWKSATPGKLALGLTIRLRERPGTLPWSSIAARVLVQQGIALLAFMPLVYFALFWFPWLDGLWASWDRKKQALHDKAARTNVVRTG